MKETNKHKTCRTTVISGTRLFEILRNTSLACDVRKSSCTKPCDSLTFVIWFPLVRKWQHPPVKVTYLLECAAKSGIVPAVDSINTFLSSLTNLSLLSIWDYPGSFSDLFSSLFQERSLSTCFPDDSGITQSSS